MRNTKKSKRKILITSAAIIAVIIATAVLGRDRSSLAEKIIAEKISTNTSNIQKEFEKFVTGITPIDASFREHYEITNGQLSKALDILREGKALEAGFKVQVLQSIKKTQRDLEKLKQFASSFINSKNYKIKELSKECLKLEEYANKIMEHRYSFISSPEQYGSSDAKIQQLTEYTALFNEQYEYLTELAKKTKDTASLPNIKPVEFQETKKEKKLLSQWKNKTTEAMLADADQGDAAALHLMGMCYRYGLNGFPINLEAANKYFAASASLGFAPALEQIRLTYLEDQNENLNKQIFLQLVYLNLISSFGHSEFTLKYHEFRKLLTERMGPGITNEIERIATQKAIRIYETQNSLEASEDKAAFIITLLETQGIVEEDSKFEGNDYWYNIFQDGRHTSSDATNS